MFNLVVSNHILTWEIRKSVLAMVMLLKNEKFKSEFLKGEKSREVTKTITSMVQK